MGIEWSQHSADEARDREAKAMEELDVLVWEEGAILSIDKVRDIVNRNYVTVGRLKSEAKDREADQIRKSRFFSRNGVGDMERFHDHKASRYNLLAFYLGIIYNV